MPVYAWVTTGEPTGVEGRPLLPGRAGRTDTTWGKGLEELEKKSLPGRRKEEKEEACHYSSREGRKS